MTDTDSNLVRHAERELRLAGLLDKDSDYDGMLGEATLAIVRLFSEQGHSGMSAALVTDLATRLMRFEPLTPLTDDPDEWMHVAEEAAGAAPGLWQSRRNPEAFSNDGGKTHYTLSDETVRATNEKE